MLARIFLIATLLGVAGCKTRAPSSETKHSLYHPTNDDSLPWNWSKFPRADAQKTPLFKNTLPEDHPLTIRAQFWLDQIDSYLRRRFPEDLVKIPRPLASVEKVANVNAMVGPVKVCFPNQLLINGGDGTLVPASYLYFNLKIGTISMDMMGDACQKPGFSSSLETIINDINARHYGSEGEKTCVLTLKTDQSLIQEQGCTDIPSKALVDGFPIDVTANWIHIYSGDFLEFSEDEFVAILAHELGHYYKTHITTPKRGYDYLYKLGDKNLGEKPPLDPALKPLGDRIKKAAFMVFDQNGSDTGKKISTRINNVLTSWATTSSDADCSLADMNDRQAFEDHIIRCLSKITLSSDEIWSKNADMFFARFDFEWKKDQQGHLIALTGPFTQLDLPKVKNVWESVSLLSDFVRTQDNVMVQTLQDAVSGHYGFYTMEQEADELSIEWVTALGIDPLAALNAQIKMGQITDKQTPKTEGSFIIGMDRCIELYKNHWLDEDGHYVFVSIGEFSESHHNGCYRVFNVDREITAHGYEQTYQSSEKFRLPAGMKTWSDMQAIAKSL